MVRKPINDLVDKLNDPEDDAPEEINYRRHPRKKLPIQGPRQPKGLPRGPDGKVLAGPGRGKGSVNKVTQEAKHVIAKAFEDSGGVAGMVKWIKKSDRNRGYFYTQVYTKLLPMQIKGKIDVENTGDGAAAAALERILVGIIDSRSIGGPVPPVVIDQRPDPGPPPRLVLSSSTGAEAAGDPAGPRRAVAELVVSGGTRRGED